MTTTIDRYEVSVMPMATDDDSHVQIVVCHGASKFFLSVDNPRWLRVFDEKTACGSQVAHPELSQIAYIMGKFLNGD